MAKKDEIHKWNDQFILDPDDIQSLEHEAALNEFEHGNERSEAEKKAYQSYKAKFHREGAAHHLRGLKAAQASGDIDEAHKHGVVYALHMEALGHDPMDAVPPEINELIKDGKKQYKFKAHNADKFLIHKSNLG